MQLLLKQLLQYQWSAGALKIWANSDFKCVYCGLDMLESLDNYKLGEVDHLLPQSRYPDLIENSTNLVLSCWVCNRLKRHWDPNTRVGDPVYPGDVGTGLTDKQRNELISRARQYVEAARNKKSAELVEMRNAIDDYRKRLRGGVGGA